MGAPIAPWKVWKRVVTGDTWGPPGASSDASQTPFQQTRYAPPRMALLEEQLRAFDGLVVALARRIAARMPPNILAEDLISAGRVGLWQLLQKNPEASEWVVRMRVRGAILDELRAEDWLKRRMRDKGAPFAMVGFEDLTGLYTNWEGPPTPAAAEGVILRRAIDRAIDQLDQREQYLLRAIYFQGRAQRVVAASLRISQPRLTQLHIRAIERLRAILVPSTEDQK